METIQTAVEYLQRVYFKTGMLYRTDFEIAKKMEREQILRDYEFGLHNGVCHCHGDRLINSPEYYKETYGGKDE
jgi:hypothetical protein